MHGLINRALENVLRQRHGTVQWQRIAASAGLPFESFEPLLTYDIALTEAVIAAACRELERPRDSILEDVGTALISLPAGERLRRLLRFGGVTFHDFLYSLEDLPARARLALPDLVLPGLRLTDLEGGEFRLNAEVPFAGAGCILMGLLRAMADDYGALVLLDMIPTAGHTEEISILLLDAAHAEGRPFDLAAGVAGGTR
ncbi:MAG: heme NO-binding domain-containing protein [Rhodobacteraceae bacterium]|nr:heme NO-binding domain-containing protein [Paracoccaceae bacterium]